MNKNIRAAYLNSLGFQEAPIQSWLEAILKENVIDIEKLKKLCIRFEIPANYKNVVWKLLLGVLPPYREACNFVQQKYMEQYSDLKRIATLLTTHNESSEKGSEIIFQIYHTYRRFQNRSDEDDDPTELKMIAHHFARVFDNECDAYFCFDKFLSTTVERFGLKSKSICHQMSLLSILLKNEDPELFHHLEQRGVKLEHISYTYISEKRIVDYMYRTDQRVSHLRMCDVLIFVRWFRSNLTTLCTDSMILESLWCKVMAISYYFNACIVFAFLTSNRMLLLSESDPDVIKNTLRTAQTKFVSEYPTILNKALESLPLLQSTSIGPLHNIKPN